MRELYSIILETRGFLVQTMYMVFLDDIASINSSIFRSYHKTVDECGNNISNRPVYSRTRDKINFFFLKF